MIKRLYIQNFKAFREFDVKLGPRALLIGPNNAGKSTLVAALRLIAYLTRPGQLRGFRQVGTRGTGIEFSLAEVGIHPVSLTHNNSLQPAEILVEFDDDLELRIQMRPGEMPLAEWLFDGGKVTQARFVHERLRSNVGVVPQVGPLEYQEDLLSEKYVKQSIETNIGVRHFRNQWYYQMFGSFDVVSSAIEATIPGIHIYEPNMELGEGKPNLTMDYREGAYAAELAQAGHGVQVWVQLISHLARLSDRRSVVLDEPDVYLHPDLQRRIPHLIDALEVEQFILATHSVEILNEFDLDEVIQVDKRTTKGRVLGGLTNLRRLTDGLGSKANAYFARLARERVTLFVEGTDFELLRKWAELAGNRDFGKALQFGVFPIDGASNWDSLLPLTATLRNFTGDTITAFVVLDRDYRCDGEIEEIRDRLRKAGVKCFFWGRKEIENYLLVPEAISRAITGNSLAAAEIAEMLKKAIDETREYVTAQRTYQVIEFEKRRGSRKHMTTIQSEVMKDINKRWDYDCIDLCPGKDVLARLRSRMEDAGVKPPGDFRIIDHMSHGEIHRDILSLLDSITTQARTGRPNSRIKLKRD